MGDQAAILAQPLLCAHPPMHTAATAVIDTNVVLDGLVFGNPEVAPLMQAIGEGRLRWLATPWMREELACVVARGLGPRWPVEWAPLAVQWDRLVTPVDPPPEPALAGRLRCSDPLDQPFIDLAIAARVQWLLTRDRAVLKLARRAAAHGVNISPPGRWQPGA